MAKLPPQMARMAGDRLGSSLIGSPATIRQRLQAFEEVGVQELIIAFPDALKLDSLRFFAKEFIS